MCLVFFSYNRVTFIKNSQRLFEIAEPAVIVTLFMVMFFCISDTGPSPAGKRFMVVGMRVVAAVPGVQLGS
jgi:hypothetical protein